MAWDDDLLPDQRAAASHGVGPGRVLAGPGTGKTLTLTRRVCYLLDVQRVNAGRVLALTFTRAAARELTNRVAQALGPAAAPRIATLHSFALRQLLRSAGVMAALPQPLRVADDWEERHLVLEDLKQMLRLPKITQARDLLHQLSADWQTLNADDAEWDRRFPNPAFLGAWNEHRERYGYTLRAELVYQLKRALEQYATFQLEGPPDHLLVDEYQDLNRCDLAVVAAVARRGAQIFIAGDDDQSIYGFRKAHPQGIRRFPEDYHGAVDLPLSLCKRCAPHILELGLFVARQDYARLEKPLLSENNRPPGEVALLRFPEEEAEADGVVGLCRYLINRREVSPDKILILLRSDRHGLFSEPIRARLSQAGVPVASRTGTKSPLDAPSGREFLSFLRLLSNEKDHLAWRTLLEVRQGNRVGPAAVAAITDLCRARGHRLADVVQALRVDADALPTRLQGPLRTELTAIWAIREELRGQLPPANPPNPAAFAAALQQFAERLINDAAERAAVVAELGITLLPGHVATVAGVLSGVEAANDDIEQDLQDGSVNILTMHKAKGLSADAVIVLAAEDEYIPGRAGGDAQGDERRLLYVSLTRAREFLFITYCEGRPGAQRHSGRSPGQVTRSLTRFLRDGPLAPRSGTDYVRTLMRAGR